MSRPTPVLLAALLAATPVLRAPAQQTFPTGVELVAVDVTVVDRQGRPVTDLRPEDFTVTVAGRPRTIVGVRLVRHELATRATAGTAATAGAPESATAPPAPLPPRVVVLVPDTSSLSSAGAHAVTKAGSRFLDLLGPRDLVALVPIPTGPAVDLTTDRARLREALGKLIGGKARVSTFSHVTLAEAFSRYGALADRRTWGDAVRRECSSCRTAPECESCERMLATDARAIYETALAETRVTRDTLLRLFGALAGFEGPKTVVLFSQGLVTGTSGGDLGGGHDLARIGEAAAAARASVYTVHIDRTFVEAMEASQARIADSVLQDSWLARDGLEAIASYTGGALIRTVTTADFPLERVALETSAVWLLSFEPLAQDRDGKAHEIHVKVARPGVEVRARPQFVVPKTPPAPLAAAVAAAPPPPTPAEAAARALEDPAPGTRADIRFAAHILGGDAAAVELVVAAELPIGTAAAAARLVDGTGRPVPPGTLDLRVEPLASGGAAYGTASAAVPPGDYVLRLAAADPSGRVQAAESPIAARLHTTGLLHLSDLLLAEPGARAGGGSAITVREVRGSALRAYVEVAGAAAARLGVQFEVGDASGQTRLMANAPVSAEVGSRLSAETSLDLVSLPAGRYVVRAVVLVDGEEAGRVEREIERTPGR